LPRRAEKCGSALRLEVAANANRFAHDFAPVINATRCERKKVEMLFAHFKRILKLGRLRLRGPWPAAGFVDTGLGSHSSFLERHRAEIAQLGMASRGVVEALDVVEDVGPGVIASTVDLAGRPLGLQR
jgi:hypothetical protein